MTFQTKTWLKKVISTNYQTERNDLIRSTWKYLIALFDEDIRKYMKKTKGLQKGIDCLANDVVKKRDKWTGLNDELLERIREIRASEKRFYQKVRDLFALSSDYDKTDKATQMFFAETQNKLLFAVKISASHAICRTRGSGQVYRPVYPPSRHQQ